jgi:hypothetical protein
VLDRLPELKDQRLILLTEWDSFKNNQGDKISTGLTQGTIKVLSDPEAGSKCEEEAIIGLAIQDLLSRREGILMATPFKTKITERRKRSHAGDPDQSTVKNTI